MNLIVVNIFYFVTALVSFAMGKQFIISRLNSFFNIKCDKCLCGRYVVKNVYNGSLTIKCNKCGESHNLTQPESYIIQGENGDDYKKISIGKRSEKK